MLKWHVLITNSVKNKSPKKKIQNRRKKRGRIRCHRGVSILCWLTGYIHRVLLVKIGENVKVPTQYVINYGLTISIKKRPVSMRPSWRLYLLTSSLYQPFWQFSILVTVVFNFIGTMFSNMFIFYDGFILLLFFDKKKRYISIKSCLI